MMTVSVVLFGCGGTPRGTGNSSSSSSFSSDTIGGTVTGLTGSGLVLQDDSGDNLSITASGPFTFKTAIASGKTYSVSVLTQPTTPAQTCTVASGSGTASANVTSVAVSCTTNPATIGGAVSGTVGLTVTPGALPGSRWGATAWTDRNGNLGLFGGWGQDSTGTNGNGFLNDLWVYTPSAVAGQPGTWVWVKGSNTGNPNGAYGSLMRPYAPYVIWTSGGRRGTAHWGLKRRTLALRWAGLRFHKYKRERLTERPVAIPAFSVI